MMGFFFSSYAVYAVVGREEGTGDKKGKRLEVLITYRSECF